MLQSSCKITVLEHAHIQTFLHDLIKGECPVLSKNVYDSSPQSNVNTKFNLENVGKVIRDLTFDTYGPLYLTDSRYILAEDEIVRKESKREKKNEAILFDSDEDSGDEIDENETGAAPFLTPNAINEGLAHMTHAMVPTSKYTNYPNYTSTLHVPSPLLGCQRPYAFGLSIFITRAPLRKSCILA